LSETYFENSSAKRLVEHTIVLLIHFMMNNRVQQYLHLSLKPKVQWCTHFDSGAWLRTTFWNNLWFICYFLFVCIVQKMIHPGFSAHEIKALKAVGWMGHHKLQSKATSGQGCLGLPSQATARGTHPGLGRFGHGRPY
jgi:hypothetical protein